MISMDKKYRTRDGRAARILCVDRKDVTYQVVALIQKGDQEIIYNFNSDGTWCGAGHGQTGPNDLIEIKPEVVTYTNLYSNGSWGVARNNPVDCCVAKAVETSHIGHVKTTIVEGEQPKFEFIPKE